MKNFPSLMIGARGRGRIYGIAASLTPPNERADEREEGLNSSSSSLSLLLYFSPSLFPGSPPLSLPPLFVLRQQQPSPEDGKRRWGRPTDPPTMLKTGGQPKDGRASERARACERPRRRPPPHRGRLSERTNERACFSLED